MPTAMALETDASVQVVIRHHAILTTLPSFTALRRCRRVSREQQVWSARARAPVKRDVSQ